VKDHPTLRVLPGTIAEHGRFEDGTPMPAPLPPFTGDHPVCTMCGHREAVTKFLGERGLAPLDPPSTSLTPPPGRARLHRTCGRCGYCWDEATVTPDTSSACALALTSDGLSSRQALVGYVADVITDNLSGLVDPRVSPNLVDKISNGMITSILGRLGAGYTVALGGVGAGAAERARRNDGS